MSASARPAAAGFAGADLLEVAMRTRHIPDHGVNSAEINRFPDIPDDVVEAVEAQKRRSALRGEGRGRCVVILEKAALHTGSATPR